MKKIVLILIMAVFASGCATLKNIPFIKEKTLADFSYEAAEQLASQLRRNHQVNENFTYVVATMSNIDTLEQSNSFGRLFSEQLSIDLTWQGLNTVEIKLREQGMIDKSEGEFFLSRDIQDIASIHNVDVVVVGTYTKARDNMFITLKAVSTSTNLVLASYGFSLPVSDDVLVLSKRHAKYAVDKDHSSPVSLYR